MFNSTYTIHHQYYRYVKISICCWSCGLYYGKIISNFAIDSCTAIYINVPNVVLRLSSIVPKFQNFKIYFDNYYTTLTLIVYLAKQGICSLGTLRRNRVPGIKLSNDKELKKKVEIIFQYTLHNYNYKI